MKSRRTTTYSLALLVMGALALATPRVSTAATAIVSDCYPQAQIDCYNAADLFEGSVCAPVEYCASYELRVEACQTFYPSAVRGAPCAL